MGLVLPKFQHKALAVSPRLEELDRTVSARDPLDPFGGSIPGPGHPFWVANHRQVPSWEVVSRQAKLGVTKAGQLRLAVNSNTV